MSIATGTPTAGELPLRPLPVQTQSQGPRTSSSVSTDCPGSTGFTYSPGPYSFSDSTGSSVVEVAQSVGFCQDSEMVNLTSAFPCQPDDGGHTQVHY